jgi:hypothetical protein
MGPHVKRHDYFESESLETWPTSRKGNSAPSGNGTCESPTKSGKLIAKWQLQLKQLHLLTVLRISSSLFYGGVHERKIRMKREPKREYVTWNALRDRDTA